ncbi:MAG TPA: PQQ-binding-like beta-propeller repeat protein [Gemmatimonadaceae bacterium]|jgi:alcohol dehydrogenase (cytochrome c)|nr:PQQ-binding-like beta-propeller repeat protein [Gemmatimonadaceae bacterium]
MIRASRAIIRASGAAALVACGGASTASVSSTPASGVPAGDWPSYNRTLAGDRFSPLAEIDRSNVASMREVCTYTLPEVAALQAGPVVIGGAMYFSTDTMTYAIDAATCAEKWKRSRHVATPGGGPAVNRGVAYLDGRVFRGTSDTHVLALDAADGHTVWDVPLDVAGPGVQLPMAPIAWKGMVFIGNAGGDRAGVIGHVYALDAATGQVTWKFDVIPASGPAHDTWGHGAAATYPISGGAFWTSFTLDETAGVLFVSSGNPAPDFDSAMRDGENLYANSLIALDATSGRMLAFNQLVKHDFHDWDVDSPSPAVTIRSGRAVVASANKDGLLSVVDRTRVASRAAANGISGAPSQLPVLYQVATTTRENVDVPLSRDRATRFCPGILGGAEWNGAAYDPTRNTFFVGANDWCSTVQLQRENSPVPRIGAAWFGNAQGGQRMDSATAAKGWLTAFDAENGNVRWKFQAPKPVLAGVTPTAGGLVFTADLGGDVYAFDADNGQARWQVSAGQSIGGGVVSYVAGGHQRIGVASGMRSPIWPGGSQSSHVVVYGVLR